jgi:hemerythrin-like domain-containing protein
MIYNDNAYLDEHEIALQTRHIVLADMSIFSTLTRGFTSVFDKISGSFSKTSVRSSAKDFIAWLQ